MIDPIIIIKYYDIFTERKQHSVSFTGINHKGGILDEFLSKFSEERSHPIETMPSEQLAIENRCFANQHITKVPIVDFDRGFPTLSATRRIHWTIAW